MRLASIASGLLMGTILIVSGTVYAQCSTLNGCASTNASSSNVTGTTDVTLPTSTPNSTGTLSQVPPPADVTLTVNGQTGIVSDGKSYTVAWSSKYVQACEMQLTSVLGTRSTQPPPNLPGMLQSDAVGTYTLSCISLDGKHISRSVSVAPPILQTPTVQPQPAADTSISPNINTQIAPPVPLPVHEVPAPQPQTMSVSLETPPQVSQVTLMVATTAMPTTGYLPIPRELKQSVPQENPNSVSPVVRDPAQGNTAGQENMIDMIRKDEILKRSSEKLEEVGRGVRRFEQTITRESPEVFPTLSPEAHIPGVTDKPQIVESVEALKERGGLDLYTDGDHDGVSDYDETHLYGTNPRDAHSAGDALSDGERIMQGLNPLSTSPEKVTVESPVGSGTESQTIFEVTDIHVEQNVVSTTTSPDHKVESSVTASLETKSAGEDVTTFQGRALPNSFVTLYIFSTPVVVTVKTDEAGNWKYTLNTELEDGSHKLYVAMVNNDGRIIAKSPPVLFTKEAQAIEFVPLVAPPITEPTLIDTLRDNLIVVGGIVLLVFGGIIVGYLGIKQPGISTPVA